MSTLFQSFSKYQLNTKLLQNQPHKIYHLKFKT